MVVWHSRNHRTTENDRTRTIQWNYHRCIDPERCGKLHDTIMSRGSTKRGFSTRSSGELPTTLPRKEASFRGYIATPLFMHVLVSPLRLRVTDGMYATCIIL